LIGTKNVLSKGVLSLFLVSVYGCASNGLGVVPDAAKIAQIQEKWNNTNSLTEIQGLMNEGDTSIDDEAVVGEGSRYSALKEGAFSLGMQFGLYQRRKSLNSILSQTQSQLVKLFDFTSYMLPGNVFPPVITETEGSLQQVSPNKIRAVRYSYHIVTSPQLVIETPTYLNYLVRHYRKPAKPDSFMLPRDSKESKNWKQWVAEGYSVGEKQANMQYESDLYRLKRDLNGVKLFHSLVARNVLTMPKLTRQDFGIIKSQDGKTLNIGDEVISVDQNINYQDAVNWKSILSESSNG
jgi:defect-in-organelle-trafficking protein DotC